MADNQANIDDAKTAADDLFSEAQSAISDLQAAASALYTAFLTQTGFDNNPNWNVDRGREVALSGMGGLPADAPTFDKPIFVFNPEDYLNSDLLQRYSYQSDFFDNFLDTRLRTYIDSAGYFLEQTVQDALFEQTRQRDLQTLNDALDAVDRKMARTGFPVPTSMHLAARNDIIKKYQDTYADRNKEITALIAAKSLEEKLAAIEAGVKMEDIRSRFQLEFGRLYWQAADYIIKKYESDVRAEMAEYEGQLKMILAKLEADRQMAGFDVQYEQMDQNKELARLEAHVAEMKVNFDSWKQEADMRLKAAEFAAEFYGKASLAWLGGVNLVDFVDKTGV